MTALLYINSHPLEAHESMSLTAAERFLEVYRDTRPEDEIVRLDLYRADVPALDADVLRGWNALRSGAAFDDLPTEAKKKIARLGEIVDQFLAADKFLIVSPMWNFSYPPVLKAYLDAVTAAGKTFRYTAEGPIGLATGRKAIHIQASGGVYGEGPAAAADHGHRHLRAVLNFIGITDVERFGVEGHNQFPERMSEIREQALERAAALARIW
ncbi:FMN-dependent NADH-azoreductase [Paenibacillus sp.]|uniref:FMN-dependent NADH-azoreductase n=1 Tax=Paenibacillus sp. TaxID=58172 RepID=UPI002811CA0D|nr:FMN-dependent NADH-azoreductase [Paenibacillus sp.]